MTPRYFLVLISSIVLVALPCGCGQIIDYEKNLEGEDSINTFVSTLEKPLPHKEGEENLASNTLDPDYIPDNDYFEYEKKSYYAAPPSQSLNAHDLPDNLLWPGAILHGKRFEEGFKEGLVSPEIVRAPLTIEIDITGYEETPPTTRIPSPNRETVMEEVKALIEAKRQSFSSAEKFHTYYYFPFTTGSEFIVKAKSALGYTGAFPDSRINTLYALNDGAKQTRIFMIYEKSRMSVKLSSVYCARDFFDYKATPWEALRSAVGSGKSMPLVVSSIEYGRSIMAIIESEKTYNELRPLLDAYGEYLGGAKDEEIIAYINQLSSVASIHALCESGNTSNAINLFSEVSDWLASSSNEEFNWPMRYSLRCIDDPLSVNPLSIVLGGEYYRIKARWEKFAPSFIGANSSYNAQNDYAYILTLGVWFMAGGKNYRVKGCAKSFSGTLWYSLTGLDGKEKLSGSIVDGGFNILLGNDSLSYTMRATFKDCEFNPIIFERRIE